MDRETALVWYRALQMICKYLEKRYGFGGVCAAGDAVLEHPFGDGV